MSTLGSSLHLLVFTGCISSCILSGCYALRNETLSGGESCQLRRISQVIKKSSCVPKRIISYACMGGCHSYSEVVPDQDLRLLHHCECCREHRVYKTNVKLQCRDLLGVTGKRFRTVDIGLAFPTSCLCRPCSSGLNYEAQEFSGMADEVKRLWSVLHVKK